MYNIVIIGAGVVGTLIAKYLANSPEISHVVLADVDAKKLSEAEDEISSDKISTQKVDASSYEEVSQAIKDNDLVINAALPSFNLQIMDACLENKVHYVDLLTNRAVLDDQLKRNDEFKKKGLGAVLGMGVSPGITNLFARKAADQLDEVESIIIRVGGSGTVAFKDLPLAPGFSPRSFIEEWVVEPALVYKNGEFIEVPHFSGEEDWEFPDIGAVKIYYCYHDEVDAMPRAYPQVLKNPSNVEFKYAISQRAKNALIVLNEIGLTRGEPIEVSGKQVVPIEVVAKLLPDPKELIGKAQARGYVTVEVKGKKEGKETSYSYFATADNDEAFAKYRTDFTALLTGLSPAILVEFMAKGLEIKGVITPECLDPDPILDKYGEICQVGEIK